MIFLNRQSHISQDVMRMNSICIYPKDETTAFLKPIADYLIGEGYYLFDGDTRQEGVSSCLLDFIGLCDDVVFLGHGSSGLLYGSEMTEWIKANNMDILRGKKLFLLSCNSREFISGYNLQNAIGFDNIPTGQYDLNSIYDNDFFYFENVLSDEDVNYFKDAIVQIVIRAFKSVGMTNMNMLANKIKMYTNRVRFDCVSHHRNLNYRDILRMLYDFKEGMLFVDKDGR